MAMDQSIKETPLSGIENLLKFDKQSCRSLNSMNSEAANHAYEE
jgi:hypothetical protein